MNGPGGRKLRLSGVRRRSDCRFWQIDPGAWRQDNLLGWAACASKLGWGASDAASRAAAWAVAGGHSWTLGPAFRGGAGAGGCARRNERGEVRTEVRRAWLAGVKRVAAGQALRARRVRGRTTSW